MSEDKQQRRPRRAYEPPAIEDVPINPDERLLVPCKSATGMNPVCMDACTNCREAGS